MSNILSLMTDLKEHHYAYHLWMMLAPPAVRQDLLALLSLDVELAAIPSKVSEEMLGHIRYTWWQESFELLEKGDSSRKHPILELWKGDVSVALALINLHRKNFERQPDACPDHALEASREYVKNAGFELIKAHSPKHARRWKRKTKIVNKAQAKGECRADNAKLTFRLLF